MDLPKTDSEVLNVLWDTQIKQKLDDLAEIRSVLDSYNPPTQEAVDKYFAYASETDTSLREILYDLHKYRHKVKQLEETVQHMAEFALQRPFNSDEKAAFRAKYNFVKKNLISSVSALRSQAGYEENTAVEEFCSELLDSLKGTGIKRTPAQRNVNEMRAWLQKNRPDLDVRDKGKISLLAQIAYEERNRDND